MCGSPIKKLINYAEIGRNKYNHDCIFYTWKFICTNKNVLLPTIALLLLPKPHILVIKFTLIFVVLIISEPNIVRRSWGI